MSYFKHDLFLPGMELASIFIFVPIILFFAFGAKYQLGLVGSLETTSERDKESINSSLLVSPGTVLLKKYLIETLIFINFSRKLIITILLPHWIYSGSKQSEANMTRGKIVDIQI